MSLNTNIYEFGNFRLDAEEKVLLQGGTPVAITPKVFDLLLALVESHGRIVGKDVLMESVWAGSFVEESNLTFTIRQLRKLLGDDKSNPKYVETIPRRGYRFVAEVNVVNGNGQRTIESAEAADNPEAIFADLNTSAAPAPQSRNRLMVYSAGGLLLVVAVAAGFYYLNQSVNGITGLLGFSGASKILRAEKLTETGNALGVNISPDGKMIAYITREAGKHVIWLRQLATGQSIQIIPPVDETYHGLSFSNDGEHLYFVHQPRNQTTHLSRISILGGTPTKILSGLHGGIDFSPDGRELAFIRFSQDGSSIRVADIEGRNERQLLTAPNPRHIIDVAWSPDGKSIAYCLGQYPGPQKDFEVRRLDISDGADRSLTDAKWSFIENIVWLNDNSGLLINGHNSSESDTQIWRLALPTGTIKQITFDSSPLRLRGVTSDGTKIIATRSLMESTVWLGLAENPGSVQPVIGAQFEATWTPDNRLVFPAEDTVNTDIWIMNADGSGRKQLTANDSIERLPAVSPDGRFVVFVASAGGRQNIWRMNVDGSEQVKLTDGGGETNPAFLPDGRFVVFNSAADGNLWKVPIEGGEPAKILSERATRVSISPDGASFAYFGRKDGVRKILVRSLADGSYLHEFEANIRLVSPQKIVWEHDGKSLLYIVIDESYVGNLYRQPLDSPGPAAVTQFNTSQIFDFDICPRGEQIAIVRGTWNHDAVLLTGL